MWFIKLAWKNMWRNKHRTMITMASIFFAVILSILTSSLKTGIFENLIQNMVRFYSGYIQIHKKGFWDEQILDNSFERPELLENKISSIHLIKSVSPRLESFILASTGKDTKGCLVLGINPEKENFVTNFPSLLIKGSYITNNDQSIVLSEGLLRRLRAQLNDTIVLFGQGYHGETAAGKFSIKGIVKLGTPALNDQLILMPLEQAQQLFGAYNISTTYAIGIHESKRLDQIASSIKNIAGPDFEVMTWEEMMPDIKQHLQNDTRNMQIVQGILYLLICFGIFSTLVMMMAERTFELGMLISIGMHKIKLVLILMIESLFTVMIGCISGIISSIPIVIYLNKKPIRLKGNFANAFERFGFEAIFPTSTKISIFLNQGLIVFILGLLLSTYIIFKIIKMNPVEAIRK